MRRPSALLALGAPLAVGLVVVLSGCGGDTPDAPQQSPTEQLAAAKTAFDTAKTVQLDLTSRDVPPRENGVTRAEGSGVISATEPKFQGTITGTIKGLASSIEDLFHLGDGTGTYAVSYGLTDADQLRTATLTGPFFPGVQATYVVKLTDYGTPVEITSP